MSKFLSLLCSMLICVATYAQNITVNGKVTANGEEMPGVTVAVKGGTNGTITSIDDSYSLQVDAKSTLVFSFIGYETVEMPVKGQKVINVDLKESSVAIDEVVIAVPYGTAKKIYFHWFCQCYRQENCSCITGFKCIKSLAGNCSRFAVVLYQWTTG